MKMNREAWLAERKKGIGGSDIAAILGLNKYKSPLDVWHDKQPTAVEIPQNEDMLRGTMLEDFVAKMWANLSGNTVTVPPKMIYSHKDYPYAKASPDRFYGIKKDRGILECKTSARKIDVDNVPEYWICQLQWYMFILGVKKGTIAWCCSPGFTIDWLEMDANPELHEQMISHAGQFWNQHIELGVPPKPLTAQDVTNVYPVSEAKIVEASEDIMQLHQQYRELQTAEKTIKEGKEAIADQIKAFMLESDTLKYGDNVVATFKSPKPTPKLNEDRLKKDMPEVYNAFLEPSQGSRRFLVKEI